MTSKLTKTYHKLPGHLPRHSGGQGTWRMVKVAVDYCVNCFLAVFKFYWELWENKQRVEKRTSAFKRRGCFPSARYALPKSAEVPGISSTQGPDWCARGGLRYRNKSTGIVVVEPEETPEARRIQCRFEDSFQNFFLFSLSFCKFNSLFKLWLSQFYRC